MCCFYPCLSPLHCFGYKPARFCPFVVSPCSSWFPQIDTSHDPHNNKSLMNISSLSCPTNHRRQNQSVLYLHYRLVLSFVTLDWRNHSANSRTELGLALFGTLDVSAMIAFLLLHVASEQRARTAFSFSSFFTTRQKYPPFFLSLSHASSSFSSPQAATFVAIHSALSPQLWPGFFILDRE